MEANLLGASTVVLIATAALLLAALLAFGWALSTGQLDHLSDQAEVILDDRDCRIVRPWETAEQQQQRVEQHGAPLAAEPGEWGGWS